MVYLFAFLLVCVLAVAFYFLFPDTVRRAQKKVLHYRKQRKVQYLREHGDEATKKTLAEHKVSVDEAYAKIRQQKRQERWRSVQEERKKREESRQAVKKQRDESRHREKERQDGREDRRHREKQQHEMMSDDMERAIARQKNYVGAAVLTFLLYLVFFLPGLLANLLYLSAARKAAKAAGRAPTGIGCLWIMLILGILPWVIVIMLIVFGVIATG